MVDKQCSVIYTSPSACSPYFQICAARPARWTRFVQNRNCCTRRRVLENPPQLVRSKKSTSTRISTTRVVTPRACLWHPYLSHTHRKKTSFFSSSFLPYFSFSQLASFTLSLFFFSFVWFVAVAISPFCFVIVSVLFTFSILQFSTFQFDLLFRSFSREVFLWFTTIERCRRHRLSLCDNALERRFAQPKAAFVEQSNLRQWPAAARDLERLCRWDRPTAGEFELRTE